MPGCGTVYCDNAFGGEDSDSNIYIGDDYMYTYTLSFFFPFSLTQSLSLVLSLFSSVSLSVSLFHTHKEIYITCFWMWGRVLRSMSRSVGCEFLDISWLIALFLLMFGKVYIDSYTHPLTRSQVYPPLIKCHINTQCLGARYQVTWKKRWKVTQTPSMTRYDIVTTLQLENYF